jgi:hypothetical protein
MSTASYDVGDESKLTATFKNIDSVLTAPTTITLKVKPPSGATATYLMGASSMLNPSVGVYTYALPLTMSGVWFYRWIGTGTVTAAGEGWLRVNASQF